MKLFRVNIENIDYDEYDGFAILAENAERALELAKEELYGDQLKSIESGDETMTVDEIDITTEGCFLSSFCAG